MLSTATPRYDSPPIYITENGFDVRGESDLTGDAALDDQMRVEFLTVRGGVGRVWALSGSNSERCITSHTRTLTGVPRGGGQGHRAR